MSYGACVKFGSVDDVQRALPAEDLPDRGSRRSARVLVPLSHFPQVGYPLRCPSLQLLPLDGLSGAAEHLGQRLRLGLHRLLEEAIEEQAAVVRTAPVEAEGELIEVVVELLRADGALVGAE
jgi:hypothetical protein